MAHFGGWSLFGCTSQFGGGDTWEQVYHRNLKALDPPGVYDETEDTLHDDLQKTDALALGAVGQTSLETLEREVFPHDADMMIDQWEDLFRLAPPAGATLADRQALITSRWRAPLSSSPKHLRMMLADILNPTTAFWDRCDDEDVSFRFNQIAGNGSMAEDTTELTLSLASSAQGDWLESIKSPPRCLMDIVDRDDDYYLEVLVNSFGANDSTSGGITIYQDLNNAVILSYERTAGSVLRLGAYVYNDGVRTTLSTASPPSLPFWLVLSRVSGVYKFQYGASLDNLTILDQVNAVLFTFTPRYLGVYCSNRMEAGSPAASIGFDDIKIRYGLKWNNVELIETPLAIVPADEPEQIFFAFVHREPSDSGTYNLGEAQRKLNRAKQAHSLILVGESDCFLCDDSYSLTDRDILGS